MMEEDDKTELARLIAHTSAGVDLDRMVAMVLFDFRLEPCPIVSAGYHLIGSSHYTSIVSNEKVCTSPLPRFSTDNDCIRVILEWITNRFPGMELIWDSGRWLCNINGADSKDRWFRLAHIAGSMGMQEALCKACLLSIVNPQQLPLDFRATTVSNPVTRNPAKIEPPKKPRKRKP